VSRIPRLVKRNTILLALSQALVGAGMQMVPVLGPLLAIELLGSATMAGASVSIVGVSRLVVAYPIGKIMDVYGRRAGLVLGLFIGIIGALVTGFSVFLHSFPILFTGQICTMWRLSSIFLSFSLSTITIRLMIYWIGILFIENHKFFYICLWFSR